MARPEHDGHDDRGGQHGRDAAGATRRETRSPDVDGGGRPRRARPCRRAQILEHDARFADVAQPPRGVAIETARQQLAQATAASTAGSRDQSTSARSTAASVSATSSPLNARSPDSIS